MRLDPRSRDQMVTFVTYLVEGEVPAIERPMTR